MRDKNDSVLISPFKSALNLSFYFTITIYYLKVCGQERPSNKIK